MLIAFAGSPNLAPATLEVAFGRRRPRAKYLVEATRDLNERGKASAQRGVSECG